VERLADGGLKAHADGRPVAVEERYGLIWATLSAAPTAPLTDFLGPQVDAQAGLFHLDESVLFIDETWSLRANWKIVMDGSADILHIKFLHANTVAKMLTTGTGVQERFGRHVLTYGPRRRMADLVRDGGTVDDIFRDNMWRYMSTSMQIFPNVRWIAAPDHVELWTVWPEPDPSRSTIRIRFLVRPEILTDTMKDRVTKSWEILREVTLNEDFPMEESIQVNSLASPEGTFLYGCNEVAPQHFHAQLEDALADLGLS
jgi:phenylpropionate dioxygenase-like ring-hydroxylating dioxygenase large terminal subunit